MSHPGCTQSAQTHCQAKDWLMPGWNMLEVMGFIVNSSMILFVLKFYPSSPGMRLHHCENNAPLRKFVFDIHFIYLRIKYTAHLL
jgi:hypothetical protein